MLFKTMFNNGAQFVGLTPRPIKSAICYKLQIYIWGNSLKFLFSPSEMGHFWLSQQARCEVIVKYPNCNLLEHE